MTMGRYLKELRLSRELSLRKLALESGIDVGNLSKIERSKDRAPMNEEFYSKIASALDLSKEEKQKLVDLGSVEHSKIPDDISIDSDVKEYIPILLRTINNKKLSRDQIVELAERINKEY